MERIIRTVLALLLAVGFVAAQTALSVAADTGQPVKTSTVKTPLDRATCQSWITSLRSAGPTDPGFWAENEGRISKIQDTDCYLLATDTGESNQFAFGILTTAAATSCATRERSLGLYIGPFEAATAHHRVYMCWNGSYAYHPSGTYEYCWVSTIPLFLGDDEWCGVITNYTSLARPHMDFYVAAYSAPWWHRYGWMEFTVDRYGVTSTAYGYCCN